jgi:hypothetical protein
VGRAPDSPPRIFERPFQLWDDLACPALKYFNPISQAVYEVHYKRDQEREGIIPLSEFRTVA